MDKNVKKYRRSAVAIVCYAIAVAIMIYLCYQAGKMVGAINQFYAQNGVKPAFTEYFVYILPAMLEPLRNVVIFFVLGYIVDAVRKNNPANYASDEEIAEARIARKEAREAKKFAKGEAAAAKAGNLPESEDSVEADFAKSLEEELKADGHDQFVKAERKAGNNSNRTVKKGGNKSANSKKKSGGENSGRNNGGNGGSNNNNSNNTAGGKDGGRGGSGKQNHKGGNKKPAADKPKTAAKDAKKDSDTKEAKAAKPVKETRAPKEAKEAKPQKEAKEAKPQKEAKAPKENAEIKAPKEIKEAGEVKEAAKEKGESVFSAVISGPEEN